MSREGGDAICEIADVARQEDCRRLVERAIERFGTIDVLVNNAGISMYSPFEAITDLGVFERILAVNLLGAVYCTHFALPHLKRAVGLWLRFPPCKARRAFPIRPLTRPASMRCRVSSIRCGSSWPGRESTCWSFHRGRWRRPFTRGGLAGMADFPKRAAIANDRGMPVAECARQIVRAIERRRRELVMTAAGKVGQWVRLIAPGLIDRFVANAVRAVLPGTINRSRVASRSHERVGNHGESNARPSSRDRLAGRLCGPRLAAPAFREVLGSLGLVLRVKGPRLRAVTCSARAAKSSAASESRLASPGHNLSRSRLAWAAPRSRLACGIEDQPLVSAAHLPATARIGRLARRRVFEWPPIFATRPVPGLAGPSSSGPWRSVSRRCRPDLHAGIHQRGAHPVFGGARANSAC